MVLGVGASALTTPQAILISRQVSSKPFLVPLAFNGIRRGIHTERWPGNTPTTLPLSANPYVGALDDLLRVAVSD